MTPATTAMFMRKTIHSILLESFASALRRRCVRCVLAASGCFGVYAVSAQSAILPMNELSRSRWEAAGVGMQAGVHATDLPVMAADVDISGIRGLDEDTAAYYYVFTKKLFGSHLVELDAPGISLTGDLILDFSFGKELENDFGEKRNLYTNARGFAVSAKIGEGVYVYTDFIETQERFPGYIDHYVDSIGAVPGSGRAKPFGKDGYDYGVASGYVAGRVTPWLDLMAGHYRSFIGAGKRSLLWSDDSFNYPFASYTLRPFKGKLQYRYTLSLLQSLDRLPLGETPESIFKRHYSARHYLSFKPHSNWEVGLFETTLWTGFGDSTGTRPLPAEALLPLPLFNAVDTDGDTRAKSVVGLNGVWQPVTVFRVYGQLVAGDLDTKKSGRQIGAQAFRLWRCVDLRVEYNRVDAGVYGGTTGEPDYAHFNQSLAHPMRDGFEEVFAEGTYRHGRMFATVGYLTAERMYGASTAQIELISARLAYVFNPYSNLEVFAGVTHRSESIGGGEVTNAYWNFGLRTNLRNLSTIY